jgi:hypothetical protein
MGIRQSNADVSVLVGVGALGGFGLAIFGVSYALFIPTGRILFTSTGINNRVGTAAAVGVALIFVSLLGQLCAALRRLSWRLPVFSAGIGS